METLAADLEEAVADSKEEVLALVVLVLPVVVVVAARSTSPTFVSLPLLLHIIYAYRCAAPVQRWLARFEGSLPPSRYAIYLFFNSVLLGPNLTQQHTPDLSFVLMFTLLPMAARRAQASLRLRLLKMLEMLLHSSMAMTGRAVTSRSVKIALQAPLLAASVVAASAVDLAVVVALVVVEVSAEAEEALGAGSVAVVDMGGDPEQEQELMAEAEAEAEAGVDMVMLMPHPTHRTPSQTSRPLEASQARRSTSATYVVTLL